MHRQFACALSLVRTSVLRSLPWPHLPYRESHPLISSSPCPLHSLLPPPSSAQRNKSLGSCASTCVPVATYMFEIAVVLVLSLASYHPTEALSYAAFAASAVGFGMAAVMHIRRLPYYRLHGNMMVRLLGEILLSE